MASQVEFTELSSRIAEAPKDKRHKLELEAELLVWKENLLGQYHDIDQPYPHNITSDSRKLWLFCQYHKAKLRIHIGQSGEVCDDDAYNSARFILEATSVLSSPMVLSHW